MNHVEHGMYSDPLSCSPILLVLIHLLQSIEDILITSEIFALPEIVLQIITLHQKSYGLGRSLSEAAMKIGAC